MALHTYSCDPLCKSYTRDPTSLIVCPESQHLHDFLFVIYLVHDAVLSIEPPRICSIEIPDEFFKYRRRCKGMMSEEIEDDSCFLHER